MMISDFFKNRITKEYVTFRNEQMSKAPNIIFDECFKNYFYMAHCVFFQSSENGLTEQEISSLAKEKNLLNTIWDYSLMQMEYPISNWENIRDNLQQYIYERDSISGMS